MPTTPTYGFLFEDDSDEPGTSLRAPSPILAEQVEAELERVDTVLATATVPVMRVFTANDTWSKPTGLLAVQVRCQGGGGEGGGAPATGVGQTSWGRGGNGGDYAESVIPAASLGATETVTVGAGGDGATAGTTGNTGGQSSFGAHVVAPGGNGGAAGVATTADTFGQGNGPQTGGGTGQVYVLGEPGGPGHVLTSLNTAMGGYGGNSVLGAGGRINPNFNNGNAGHPYGGGGSGGSIEGQHSARVGGPGADGVVIVIEFFPPGTS